MGAFAAPAGAEPVLVTTDSIAEGTDFLRPDATPEQIGWKAMAVSLSDVAAMAALPMAAVVAAVFPNDADTALQEGLHRGMRRAADEFDCPIIGGDVNAWPGKLVITTTIFARRPACGPSAAAGPSRGTSCASPARWAAASWASTSNFTPRIREARALAGMVELHAMMDLSDGLSSALGHCPGEQLRRGDRPRRAADIRRRPAPRRARRQAGLAHALDDGEDFELLFTVAAAPIGTSCAPASRSTPA